MRSFTIDPLRSFHPEAQESALSEPTWTWQIPPREHVGAFINSVKEADEMLWRCGYCGPDDRGCYFMTTACFMAPKGEPHFFEGLCDGQFFLGEDAITEHGIDFEKCLTPSGYDKTLSGLDKATRASLSDSRKAIRSLAQWLAT